jgi:formate hydrogenlyase subunit 3/multisubunit Na+/H+ antiporter MnhD subunit
MMSEQVVTVTSSLPAAAFLVPLVAGALVFLGRGLKRAFWQGTALVASGITFLVGLRMAGQVLGGAVLTTWRNELRVDGLSALMVVVIGGGGFLATLYSVRYVTQPGLLTRVGAETAGRRMPTFYGLVLWFLATMVWGCVTNNIVML